MAEDVATRVAGDEALPAELRERIERAAARFDSIHERWSPSQRNESPLLRLVTEGEHAEIRAGAPAPAGDASLLARDAVSVTPILGIETDESEDAGRPRFKTLMGVPRSSPELDELAGLESNSGPHAEVPIERSALRPSAALGSSGSSRRHVVDDAPSLAGTSLPAQQGTAPSSQSRGAAAPWLPPTASSLDVSAEVAALRTSARRSPWWLSMGAVAAAAVFAVAAPRQRTHALRWLESEYRARLGRSADMISDTARALRPGASAAAPSPDPGFDRVTAQLDPPPAALPRAQNPGERGPASQAMSEAAPSAANSEDSREAAAGTLVRSGDRVVNETARSNAALERSDVSVARVKSNTSSTKSEQPVRYAHSSGTTAKLRPQVAAPRKPSQHPDSRQPSRATKVASGATKARATRQNPPRKDSGGGIIRETPF